MASIPSLQEAAEHPQDIDIYQQDAENAANRDLEPLVQRLTTKQLNFVYEYTKDYNGRAAAIRAGYHPANAASVSTDLIKSPLVISALQEIMRRKLIAAGAHPETVLSELVAIATVNIADLLDEDGALRPLRDLPRQATAAIQSLEIVTRGSGKHAQTSVKVRLWDKVGAITTLAKLMGMLKDKVEHSGAVEFAWKDSEDEPR